MTLTNIYEIVDFLIIALAPILPTTAEDAYKNFNKVNKAESVHLETLANPLKVNEQVLTQWQDFFKLRDEVNLSLENAIKEGLIKRNNEAKVVIKSDSDFIKSLDLRQLLMVGKVEFGAQTSVSVFKSIKCQRCWNHFMPSQIKEELCPLCHKVVFNE